MSNPYEGWDLIKTGAEIRKWMRELAAAEKLLENYQNAEWIMKNGIEGKKKLEKIAELKQKMETARNFLKALETAKTTLTAAQAATSASTATTASTSSGGLVNLFTRIGSWIGRFLPIGGSAATLVGGLVFTAALAGLTYLAADLAGSLAADKPVQTGDPARRQTQTQAPQRTADTKPASGVIDSSGEWTLTWNWSVTTVYFVGTVTGGPGQWSFQGSLEGGGNAVWTPAKGSAQARCSLTGEPGSSIAPAKMTCTATFPEGQPWQGESEGTVQALSYGDKIQFEYRGRGKGTGGQGEAAGIDHLDLTPKN